MKFIGTHHLEMFFPCFCTLLFRVCAKYSISINWILFSFYLIIILLKLIIIDKIQTIFHSWFFIFGVILFWLLFLFRVREPLIVFHFLCSLGIFGLLRLLSKNFLKIVLWNIFFTKNMFSWIQIPFIIPIFLTAYFYLLITNYILF